MAVVGTKGDKMHRFTWSKRAVVSAQQGKFDPAHTISAPNIADVYDGYVRQLRSGTPWALYSGSTVVAYGFAGMGEVTS